MLRRRTEDQAPIEEANVLPVMNIMFLLIPALLLAMEVASMAGIAITRPNTSVAQSKPADPQKTEGLDLKVFIASDGFRVSSSAQQQGAEAGKAVDSSAPTIGLAKPGAPADDYDRYDYAALASLAFDLKSAYPDEIAVRISAENDIPAQVLINTMDALRGWDCKLGELDPEAELPDTCMFIQPIVDTSR
jgi:biopolymer transport protein ExbD